MINRSRVAVALMAVVIAATGCGAPQDSSPVQIVGIWTGSEQKAFEQVLDGSGIDYVYTGSRNLDQLLQSDVRNQTPPDMAVVASPTDLAGYYEAGDLEEVTGVPQTDYASAWRDLVRTGDGHQYAIVLKADLKSIVWYNPQTLPSSLQDPATGSVAPTWAQLENLSRTSSPWCMGLGADSGSGFPGTDWVAAIMLRSAGPDQYTRWVHGELPWASADVKSAFTTWGSVLQAVPGGPASALLTRFDQAGQSMFGASRGCLLDSEGSFITGSYQAAASAPRPGQNFDFFALPAINGQSPPAYEVAANFAGMFRKPAGALNPQTQKLITYLAGYDGQKRWAERGSFSVHQKVGNDAYDGPVNQSVAAILTQRDQSDARLCFGASDLMGASLRAAFYQTVLSYASDPTDGKNLNRLLGQLDQVQASQSHAQTEAVQQSTVCGT
jgi:alpha-glucoside transport system substrate-binding protein